MKKLKPVRVWAVVYGESADLEYASVHYTVADARFDVARTIDWKRIVPCHLVPIEPKRKARVRK